MYRAMNDWMIEWVGGWVSEWVSEEKLMVAL